MKHSRIAAAALVLLSSGSARAATFTVTNVLQAGPGSLAQAIAAANATEAEDTIDFGIPFAGTKTIPGPFPAIVFPLILDGYTQGGASENTLQGKNTDAVLRVVLDGSGLAGGETILQIDAASTTIRGVVIANVPDGGVGIAIGPEAENVTIEGCFVGTNAAGTISASGGRGIVVDGDGAVIGGPVAAGMNVISGHSGPGVTLRSDDNTVFRNLIGSSADGSAMIANDVGIEVTGGSSDNYLGSEDPAAGNLIAFNAKEGILLTPEAGTGTGILGNFIAGNGALGIDLNGDGPTPNDEGDADEGPNNLQNAPEISSARLNGADLHVEGLLVSQPGTYMIEFFAAGEPDESGFGEGGGQVGSFSGVIPDGKTTLVFRETFTLPIAPGVGAFVTALASNQALNDTSEFSRAVFAPDAGDEILVKNTNDAGADSLRAAIDTANGNTDPNTIVFAIPGLPPHTIELESFLPVTTSVFLDGYSQGRPNTQALGTDASPGIVLDASAVDSAAVIDIFGAQGVVVRGLVIHSSEDGDAVRVFDSSRVQIEGCFLGTAADGVTGLGNAESGIEVASGSTEVTIGGSARGSRNIVSANGSSGISDRAVGTRIIGNIIGADRSGSSDLGNGTDGVFVTGSGSTIGGDEPGLANIIRANAGNGIRVQNDSTGVEIRGNAIADNGFLGIELLDMAGFPGATPNDANDLDTGGNALQNFPVLDSATVEAGTLKIDGSLDIPLLVLSNEYTLRFYASEECDPSGHGEGGEFVGAAKVEIGGGESFGVEIETDVSAGSELTATATSPFGNTSEFSACLAIRDASWPLCGDFNGDGERSASDALLALRTAVGTESCALCACDTNDSGTVTSTDALLILRLAVGQDVVLECPGC